MKIAIVGTGAMGSVYAGLFASAGCVGVAAPVNEAVTALIRAKERALGCA